MKAKRSAAKKRGWKGRARRVRLLLLDVDGVMTDGRLGFDGAGREFKFFYARDGIGIKLIQRAGLRVGILSGRKASVVELRARELGIDLLLQKIQDKARGLEAVLQRESLRLDQICYVGDDLVDLPVLLKVGLAVAVADAVPEVKAAAHFVTRKAGGRGAVREICEAILKAQGRWMAEIGRYSPAAGN
jgi:3-deoxy-D-manno-octulosonate 8-phosphate phosphatase (KDO 8-P phosphatase)